MTGPEIIAKALIIDDQGNGLILTRSETDEDRANEPDLAGGKVEEGETWEQGVAREVLEETGLDIAPEDFTLIRSHTAMKNGKNIIRGFYAARYDGSEITLSFEHSALRWVRLQDIPNLFKSPGWGDSVRYALDNNLL